MAFSFLHISDIHFDDESTSGWVFRNKIQEIIKEDRLEADCLVISGDLFNHGSLSKKTLDDYRAFLQQLPGHSQVIVVPGNHDLDRSARQHEDMSYNIFATRRNIVFDLGEKAKVSKGEFKLTDQEKSALYSMAFHAFQRFSQEMGFLSFHQPSAPPEAKHYEVQTVRVPFPGRPEYKVRFVLLNTALIAGQPVRGEQYRSRQRKLKGAYQQALSDGDSVKAAEIALEITKQQRCYEDDGELIIDEESENGSGRLSLSRDGNRLLSELPSNDPVDDIILTIFVGHHGFPLLSQETQAALTTAMRKCGSSIYLCGHAHQARFSRFQIKQSLSPHYVEQAQAGVMFRDETGFSQYGFNYASFSFENDQLIGKISSYFIVKSTSGELRWFKEDGIIEYSSSLQASHRTEVEKKSDKNTVNHENMTNKEEKRIENTTNKITDNTTKNITDNTTDEDTVGVPTPPSRDKDVRNGKPASSSRFRLKL